MKRIMLFGLLLLGTSIVRADLGDQITSSLISHVSAHSQYTTTGENRLALLASIVQIGKMNGSSIGQLRFGFTGIMNPDKNVTAGAGYVADAYVNISPFVRKYVTLDPNWTFLNSIEMGPSIAYDLREHHSYLAFSVGLAFSLQPHP